MAIASYVGATLYAANTNFEAWLARTNALSDDMGSNVVSVGTGLTINTQNTHVEAIWSANTMAVGTALRGGNTTTSAALSITSNTAFSGAAVTFGSTTDITASANVVFDGAAKSFTLNNNSFVVNSSTITFNNATTVNDTMTITGDLVVSGNIAGIIQTTAGDFDNLTVTSTATFAGTTIANLGTVTTADINGGTIDNVIIGGTVAAAGTFNGLTSTGTITFSGATVSNLGTVTTADINGGTIDGVTIGGASAGAGTFTTLTIGTNLIHDGDADTYIGFTTNSIDLQAGGGTRLTANASGIQLGGSGARVTTILDEDTLVSNSATALATQQSIKAYIDNKVVGKHTIHIPAMAMVSQETNGASYNIIQSTTNYVMTPVYEFATTANDYVQFSTQMPNSWDGSEIDWNVVWSANTDVTGDVKFWLEYIPLTNNEAIDSTWTSLSSVVDVSVSTANVHITTLATTSGLSATPNDWVIFRLYRDTTVADDNTGWVRVHGLTLKYNTTAGVDD